MNSNAEEDYQSRRLSENDLLSKIFGQGPCAIIRNGWNASKKLTISSYGCDIAVVSF